MLTMRTIRFLQMTRKNLGANGPTPVGFDMSKVDCYNCHMKGHFSRECRSPKDSRRNGVAEPQRRTVLVETSTSNALVSQCDGVRSYDCSFQANEEPANYALMAFLSSTSSSDNEVPSCLKACLESVKARLLVYKQNESIFEEDIKLLNLEVQLRDNALVTLRQKLEKAEHERDDLKQKLEKFQTSSKNLTELLASQTTKKTGLGYNSQVFTRAMFDCDDYLSLESDKRWPPSSLYDRFQTSDRYHVVPPPYTGTFMPPKPDLHVETSILVDTPKPESPKPTSPGKRRNRKACFVCKSLDHLIKDCDYHAKKMAQPITRNHAHRGNHKQYASLTHTNPQKHMVPAVVLTQSKPVSITAIRPVSAVMTQIKGNPQHALKDKGVINSGCSQHMIGNMSYLSDFEELNGAYVAFGGNLKGGKIFGKGKNKTVLWDEGNSVYLEPLSKMALLRGKNRTFIEATRTMLNSVLVTKPHNKTPYELLHGRTPSTGFMRPFCCHVTILNTLDSLGKFKGKVDEGFLIRYSVNSKAFRVFNSRTCIVQETLHVNFLENKPNVAGSGPTWLFDIDSLTRTMNYQPVTAGNQTNPSAGFQDKFIAEKAGEEIDQQYVLFPVWSFGSINPQNNDGDAAFDGKESDFDAKKPESESNISPSSNAQLRKQDDKTKKESKGKSHVESFIGYKDLSAKFEYCSYNNINDVNVAGTIVPTVGQNFPNSTNTFSVAGPSYAAARPTYGKSSFIDASQLPDDPDMPELEDITYYDDEDDVGAEADFNNLEISITEEPNRVHQALKDPSWIEAMHEELLQFKMQNVWVLVDLPHGKRAIGTKWVFRNKKDERGIVIRNKARLIYVDDVIFGATNKDLCKSFEKLMKDKFQMSSMGELTFFLGLQVKQKKDGIFISQDKYVAEILRKFGLTEEKSASTPIDTD
nr:hypothetical protein [Tanacetum cinerariifolium]